MRIACPHNKNRASNALVEIRHAGGVKTMRLDQRKEPPIDGLFISLGVFEFRKGGAASVTLSNKDANGYIIADAVQWLPED